MRNVTCLLAGWMLLSALPVLAADPSATIKVVRDAKVCGSARAFEVFVDDQPIQKVKNGDIGNFNVVPGKHRVYVVFMRKKSNVLALDAAPGETTVIQTLPKHVCTHPFPPMEINLDVINKFYDHPTP